MAEDAVEISSGEREALRKRGERMGAVLESRSDDVRELLEADDIEIDASDVDVEL